VTDADDDSAAPAPAPASPAAEERLGALLGLLRADPPVATAELPARVLRTARWQHAVRGALRVSGWMTTAAADVVGLITKGRR
jgi:hypothetical protein